MSLRENIMADIKSAMKSREAEKLTSLRFLQAQIKNKEIELRPTELTDEDVLQVIKKLVKQRKEGVEQFKELGRDDLADKEIRELAILETYMPEQMSADQLEKIISDIITELNASSMKDMGSVMKEVTARTGGAADGKTVSGLVRSKLQ